VSQAGGNTGAGGGTGQTPGGPGQASATFKVHWRQGQTVSYGAAFYLPQGFHTATTGHQALLRWDSFPGASGRVQQGGVVIDYRDNSGYLVTSTVANGSTTQRVLAGPFPLPTGTWFTLNVRQLLGTSSALGARSNALSARSGIPGDPPNPYSDVYVNGRLVAASHAPTFDGRQVAHVRYGIVGLSADAAQGPVSLAFDQASAVGYGRYVDPFAGDWYRTKRTDMGVDFCLAPGEPIRAIGDGVVVGISPDWFEGQPYLWYQLVDGPYAGRYAYVSEQITRLARVGTEVTAGEPIAWYGRSGTCIEAGWSAADGATLAQATTGYSEGGVTPSGVAFARFLISLGAHGPFELGP
jgi:murein DD-endopeptidase MepM/ murein hydrolase activator NlpD